MRGYTSWEAVSAGKNCHVGAPQSSLSSSDSTREGGDNCLGGANKIPNTKRNMVIVRYEGEWILLMMILRTSFCLGWSRCHIPICGILLLTRHMSNYAS